MPTSEILFTAQDFITKRDAHCGRMRDRLQALAAEVRAETGEAEVPVVLGPERPSCATFVAMDAAEKRLNVGTAAHPRDPIAVAWVTFCATAQRANQSGGWEVDEAGNAVDPAEKARVDATWAERKAAWEGFVAAAREGCFQLFLSLTKAQLEELMRLVEERQPALGIGSQRARVQMWLVDNRLAQHCEKDGTRSQEAWDVVAWGRYEFPCCEITDFGRAVRNWHRR